MENIKNRLIKDFIKTGGPGFSGVVRKLEFNEIITIEQLMETRIDDLLSMKGIGRKAVEIIKLFASNLAAETLKSPNTVGDFYEKKKLDLSSTND